MHLLHLDAHHHVLSDYFPSTSRIVFACQVNPNEVVSLAENLSWEAYTASLERGLSVVGRCPCCQQLAIQASWLHL